LELGEVAGEVEWGNVGRGGLSARARARRRWRTAEEGKMREVARQRGSGPIYRLEGFEAKQVSFWGRLNRARGARRCGGGRRRRRGAWWAAWQAPKCPGTRVCVRKGQGAVQVSLATLLGPVGRGRAVDEVHRWRTGGRRRNREGDGDRDLSIISEISGISW